MASVQVLHYLLAECSRDDRSVVKEDDWSQCGEGMAVLEKGFDPLIPGITLVRNTLTNCLVEDCVGRTLLAGSFQPGPSEDLHRVIGYKGMFTVGTVSVQ